VIGIIAVGLTSDHIPNPLVFKIASRYRFCF
jgi:hypothetical protein